MPQLLTEDELKTLYCPRNEAAVLATCLQHGKAYDQAAETLRPEDFAERLHALIFAGIGKQLAATGAVDLMTLAEYLETLHGHHHLDDLYELRDLPAPLANLAHHVAIVKQRAALRHWYQLGTELIPLALLSDAKPEDKLAQVQELIDRTANRAADSQGLLHASAIGEATLDVLGARIERGSRIAGLPTGLDDLDDATNGLIPGQMVAIGGRPGTGKTALALNIAAHVATTSDIEALVFSFEMSGTQLMERMFAGIGKVPLSKIIKASLDGEDFDRIEYALGKLGNSGLWIADTSGMLVDGISAQVRRRKAAGQKVGLVVVDYLQLMHGPGKNREEVVASISRALKAMALKEQLCVMALCQLNREAEKRPDKRPVIADLRESGQIEQDSDQIWLLYRDIKNRPEVCELEVAKNRTGQPAVVVPLTYLGEQTRFCNFVPDSAVYSCAAPQRDDVL